MPPASGHFPPPSAPRPHAAATSADAPPPNISARARGHPRVHKPLLRTDSACFPAAQNSCPPAGPTGWPHALVALPPPASPSTQSAPPGPRVRTHRQSISPPAHGQPRYSRRNRLPPTSSAHTAPLPADAVTGETPPAESKAGCAWLVPALSVQR